MSISKHQTSSRDNRICLMLFFPDSLSPDVTAQMFT